ncbi:DoxX family membrane protein [Galbibacter sp. PAP.153]|uniref:DoxX family membrane protein n=1 Tax=Galbibacter sp. PAP.153 TaxID=3104623 RepID=UPI00300A1DBE
MKVNILFIILRLILGGLMVYGGVHKFEQPSPTPIAVFQKAEKFATPEKESTLQKILYISGAKQTGYFWQVLGVCELLFGLLLIFQGTSFIGAIFLLPITLHIFLFHYFLESDEMGELLKTTGLLLINIALVLKEYKKWKPLLWVNPMS